LIADSCSAVVRLERVQRVNAVRVRLLADVLCFHVRVDCAPDDLGGFETRALAQFRERFNLLLRQEHACSFHLRPHASLFCFPVSSIASS